MCELPSNPETNSSSTHYNSDSCHFHAVIKDGLAQLPAGYKLDIYGRRNHYSASVLILKSMNPPVNRSAKLLGYFHFWAWTVMICSFSSSGFFFFCIRVGNPSVIVLTLEPPLFHLSRLYVCPLWLIHHLFPGNFVNKVRDPSPRLSWNTGAVGMAVIIATVKVHPRLFDVGGCE